MIPNIINHPPQLVDHSPLFCARCGTPQAQSLVLSAPPTPTICLTCDGAVVLGGPIWLERLSELTPQAAQIPQLRMAASELRRQMQHNARKLDS